MAVNVVTKDRIEKNAILRYSDTVTMYSFKYNVDANLILAVIKAESNYNENALSNKGAIGLMQIMPSTGEYISLKLNENFNENMLFSTETNIKYGTYYLSYLINKFNSIDLVIAAYNAGEGNVLYWLSKYSVDGEKLDKIPFKETENYLSKVKKYYSDYKKFYNY